MDKETRDRIQTAYEYLSRDDPQYRSIGAAELGRVGGTSVILAIFNALMDEEEVVRYGAAYSLRRKAFDCENVDDLKDLENKLSEGLADLKKKCHNKAILKEISLHFAKVQKEVAWRKNFYTKNKDILLTDKPQPPNRGKVSNQLRRRANYGR